MVNINLMAENFDAELNRVMEWNNEKREPELQERGADVNAERLRAFLKELTALSDKYEIYIKGCGCCGSPWLEDLKSGNSYDNLSFGRDSYEVGG